MPICRSFSWAYNFAAPVMGQNATRTWIVTVVFMAAMSYASVCSTMCAAGVCPSELQQSSASDYSNDMPMSHSDDCPQRRAPDNHDCSMHRHPAVNLLKADNFPRFQLTSASRITANNVLARSTQFLAFDLGALSSSGLPPPPTLGTPLDQQVPILRI